MTCIKMASYTTQKRVEFSYENGRSVENVNNVNNALFESIIKRTN